MENGESKSQDDMSIDPAIPFPISVDDGEETETYWDIQDLELNLEMFDSELYTECDVRDALGRRVRLRISDGLILEVLELIETD